MAIDYTKTFVGQVKQVVIDGVNYPVDSNGATITNVYEYSYKPVVGSAAPRVRVLRQYYRVDCIVPENTLALLKMAWNQPNAISSNANFDTLYLGLASTVDVHTLRIDTYVYGRPKQRQYYFNKACFFEPKPQQHNPTGNVNIPVSFFCYPDETQTTGREFGYVTQTTNL